MSNFGSFMLFLFATAVTQNVVLTTGFGSSMLLRIVRHPRDILPFSGILGVFSVLTVTVAYPLDALIGTDFFAKLLRPLMVVGIAAVLYLLSVLLLRRLAPAVYARTEKMLPLAAFNNLVIGVALICNHSFALPLIGAIGLALGCCVGFTVLSLLTAVLELAEFDYAKAMELDAGNEDFAFNHSLSPTQEHCWRAMK